MTPANIFEPIGGGNITWAPAPANGIAALRGMIAPQQGGRGGGLGGPGQSGGSGGSEQEARMRDLANFTMSSGPRGSMSQLSNAQLDRMTSVLGSPWTKGAAALLGLLTPVPVGSVMSGVNMLAKHEKNKRGGRDQSDFNNREWGSYDGADFGGEYDSAGYRDMMNGGRSGVVTSYDVGNFDATPGAVPGGQRIYRPKPK